jgi:hypothetical protein
MSHESIKSIAEAYKSMHSPLNEQIAQESFPDGVAFDESMAMWSVPRQAMSYLSSEQGYSSGDIVAITESGSSDMVIASLSDEDRRLVSSIPLKEGEFIGRYLTESTMAGGMMPFVKVSLLRKMLYPLTEGSSEGDTDEIRFERRGQKVRYIRVLMDFVASELGVV